MRQEEIQPGQWGAFCERFTSKHQGWLVSVDAYAAPLPGDETEVSPGDKRQFAHDVPLHAITAVPNPHGSSLLLQTGDGKRVTRLLIERPVRLRLQTTDTGADAALHIDGADGQTTRLALAAAMQSPEMATESDSPRA